MKYTARNNYQHFLNYLSLRVSSNFYNTKHAKICELKNKNPDTDAFYDLNLSKRRHTFTAKITEILICEVH